MNENLLGKNAIITGANRGIGKAITSLFAKNGCNIWACARTPNENFEKELETLARENNVQIKSVYFDLNYESQIKEACKDILKKKKKIDILVNNAAVSYGSTLNLTSVPKIQELFYINFFSQLLLVQLISKTMMKHQSGCIINMASVSGMEVYPGNLAYGSSKAALIYATKLLAKEYAPYGIRVNAVAPGTVDTDMKITRTEAQMLEVVKKTALNRIAQPEEIAEVVAFLASETSSYVTGSVLVADGGRINF